MSDIPELQDLIAAKLGQSGSLRVEVPILARMSGDYANDVNAAASNAGLVIFVMPEVPLSALQGVPFVFFDKAEVRVRIIEKVGLNPFEVTAYQLIRDIALALHWQPFPEMLSHPLYLAPKPVDWVEGRVTNEVVTTRIVDVIFIAVYGMQRTEDAPSGTFTTEEGDTFVTESGDPFITQT